jgi:hypothetical protein
LSQFFVLFLKLLQFQICKQTHVDIAVKLRRRPKFQANRDVALYVVGWDKIAGVGKDRRIVLIVLRHAAQGVIHHKKALPFLRGSYPSFRTEDGFTIVFFRIIEGAPLNRMSKQYKPNCQEHYV